MTEHVSIMPSNSFHLYPWLKQFSLILRTKSFTRYNPIRQCWPTTHSPCLLLTKSLIASCSLRRRPFFNMSLQGQVMNTVIPFLRKIMKFWKRQKIFVSNSTWAGEDERSVEKRKK